VAKSNAPYDEEQLGKVLLNPDARVSVDKKTSSLTYAPNFMKQSEKTVKTSAAKATQDMMETLAKKTVSSNSKVGVDVEDISAINI
ncbi:hypothetical protein BN1723_020935, partial [Verticillium longisporum]